MKINNENNYLNLNKSQNETNNSTYSVEQSEEMKRMQQEAIKRVHDMQNRAKRSLDAGRQYEMPPFSENSHTENQATSTKTVENKMNNIKNKDTNTHSNNNFNILQLLTKDTEKSLILFLILLLVDEKADSNLILALLYLVL